MSDRRDGVVPAKFAFETRREIASLKSEQAKDRDKLHDLEETDHLHDRLIMQLMAANDSPGMHKAEAYLLSTAFIYAISTDFRSTVNYVISKLNRLPVQQVVDSTGVSVEEVVQSRTRLIANFKALIDLVAHVSTNEAWESVPMASPEEEPF